MFDTVWRTPRRGGHLFMDTILNYWQVTLFVPGIIILLGILAFVTHLTDRK
jgi:hypothetical protein